MIGLLQRVSGAGVTVEGTAIASIDEGIMILVGFQAGDEADKIPRFIERILQFRIFSDKSGKMNLSIVDTQGQLLWVPQFTLAADTQNGRRPSFTSAAPPDLAKGLFEHLKAQAQDAFPASQFGQFGAHMHVSLTNNGPVTFWLEV